MATQSRNTSMGEAWAYETAWRWLLGGAATILVLSGRWSEGTASPLLQGFVIAVLAGASLRALGELDATRDNTPSHWGIALGSSLLVVATAYLGAQSVTAWLSAATIYAWIYAAVLATSIRWSGEGWSSALVVAAPAVALEWSGWCLGIVPGMADTAGWVPVLGRSVALVATVWIGQTVGRPRVPRRSDVESLEETASSITPSRSAWKNSERRRGDRETLDVRARASAREDDVSSAGPPPMASLDDTIEGGLRLLHRALDAHVCALLWFDAEGETLHLREAVGGRHVQLRETLDPAKGVAGSVCRAGDTLTLNDLRADFPGLVYYEQTPEIAHVSVMPIEESGHIRGMLCVDRTAGEPFSEEDLALVDEIRRSLVRVMRQTREYSDVEAENLELERFFRASRRLNSVLTPSEAMQAALHGASDVLAYDFAAITTWNEEDAIHRIAALDGADTLSIRLDVGDAFEPNAGLVASAVKNKHYLPADSRIEDVEPVIFGGRERIDALQALLVLPLVAQDRALGTLVVGRTVPDPISPRRREMLEVIANQVAVSLQNARLYARMEELATTDELTGLPNRRTFEDRLEKAVARHRRGERRLGLIMLDVDHFKAVNDTYGHAVGDRVLERVADVLQESVREIDVPARFGGEEFAVVLEEANREQASMVAERIRSDIEALDFEAAEGRFSCTVSLGVSLWPEDASQLDELVECADEALYASKEGGRNQVSVYADI